MNEKQALFVKEYLVDLNAKQAAIRAGYSAKTAEVQACKLLRVPKVASAVKEAMDKRGEKTGITAEEVLRRLDRLATIAEEQGELNAAIRANELLGKHHKLFTEKVEHSGGIQLIRVDTGVKRD